MFITMKYAGNKSSMAAIVEFKYSTALSNNKGGKKYVERSSVF